MKKIWVKVIFLYSWISKLLLSIANKTPDTPKPTKPVLSEAKTTEKVPEKPSLDEPLIPKTQEIIPQNFYTPQRGIQEERVAKFFDAAIDDIATFVRRTIGTSYEPKNNFSFTQKQKVMGYIYFKNNEDLAKSRMFTYLDVKAGTTKDSIQKRIDHLNEMKDYNRAYYIYNLAKCQNRLRTNGKLNWIIWKRITGCIGYVWGSVAACIVWNTFMKNSTHLRKLAVSALLIHAAGILPDFVFGIKYDRPNNII